MRRGRRWRSRGGRVTCPARFDDRGTAILEFTGFLPVLLLIGMATIQLGLVGYSANQAGSAARAAARVASQADGDPGAGAAAGKAAMSEGLDSSVTWGGGADTTTATVRVQVPTLLPFVDTDWSVTRSATMPNDD